MDTPTWLKFKAISVETGEWVYGTGISPTSPNDSMCEMYFQRPDGVWHWGLVIAKTVCRFVAHIPGVGDLYEGDIIEFFGGRHVVTYMPLTFEWRLVFGKSKVGIYMLDDEEFEIIGNIHDPKTQ